MELKCTNKNIKKAKIRRLRNEKKLKPVLAFIYTMLILAVFLPLYASYGMDAQSDHNLYMMCMILAIVFFVIGVSVYFCALRFVKLFNTSKYGHESLIIDSNTLFLVYKNKKDNQGVEYIIPLNKIKNAEYNRRTGRLEFKSNYLLVEIADYANASLDWDKDFDLSKDRKFVFYDHYKPSLVRQLEENGVSYTVTSTKKNLFENFENW